MKAWIVVRDHAEPMDFADEAALIAWSKAHPTVWLEADEDRDHYYRDGQKREYGAKSA